MFVRFSLAEWVEREGVLMSDVQRIGNGKVVRFHYTLRNSDNEQLDSSVEAGPLAYLHGASNVVPGLERHMSGHQTGDKFVAVIAPSEGYGEYQQPGPQPVERSASLRKLI